MSFYSIQASFFAFTCPFLFFPAEVYMKCVAFALVLLACLVVLIAADTNSNTTLTVSGLSSGAFFAHQLHVAYSGLFDGAAIVAGGPYYAYVFL
jgi:hypothetical protein